MSARAVLQFQPDAFDTGGARLMGRQAASSAFLKAWVRYAGADPLACWVNDPSHGAAFERHVRDLGASAPVEVAGIDDLSPLGRAGALWLADPNLAAHAWLRSRVGTPSGWSIVGVTHTTASHGAMDMIADLMVAPTQPWDALICTSRAVRSTVEVILERQRAYLEERLGASRLPLPQLPVIPLGVHPEDFAHQPEQRHAWREQLGIAPDDVVVLQVGRLSYHAKAHPLPLFLALEEAARRTGCRPHLILAGWFANEGQERLFRDGARDFAPSVRLHVLDGRRPDVRRSIWSAADVFALLVDNLQETFGLAPVEAMAAGLPVVVSDWDGFKDTVEHGKHGYRIPTYQPEPGAGDIMATRYEAGVDTYDVYIGGSAQSVIVCVQSAANAFAALFTDATLRANLGEAARRHVQEKLSWKQITRTYLSLLEDLAQRRPDADHRRPVPRPSRLDPFRLFQSYPTAALARTSRFRANGDDAARRLPGLYAASGSAGLASLLPPLSEMVRVLDLCRDTACPLEHLLSIGGDVTAGARLRSVSWLLKMNLLILSDPSPPRV